MDCNKPLPPSPAEDCVEKGEGVGSCPSSVLPFTTSLRHFPDNDPEIATTPRRLGTVRRKPVAYNIILNKNKKGDLESTSKLEDTRVGALAKLNGSNLNSGYFLALNDIGSDLSTTIASAATGSYPLLTETNYEGVADESRKPRPGAIRIKQDTVQSDEDFEDECHEEASRGTHQGTTAEVPLEQQPEGSMKKEKLATYVGKWLSKGDHTTRRS